MVTLPRAQFQAPLPTDWWDQTVQAVEEVHPLTEGEVVVGGPVGQPPTRLAVGASGRVLTVVNGALAYAVTPIVDMTQRASIDRTGTTDVTTAIQGVLDAMAANGEREAFVPDGDYLINGSVSVPNGMSLRTAGRNRTRFLRTAAVAGWPFEVVGSLGTDLALNANAAEGDATITTATDPAAVGIAAGGWALVATNREPWVGKLPDQEVIRVKSLSGIGPFTIAFYRTLVRDYLTVNTATIQALTEKVVTFDDFFIDIQPAALGGGIRFHETAGGGVRGLVVTNFTDYPLSLSHVSAGRFEDINYRDFQGSSNNKYGISIVNGSTYNVVRGGLGEHPLHDCVIGTGASHNRVQDRAVHGSEANAYDTHGQDCRHNVYERCVSHRSSGNGFNFGNSSYGGDVGSLAIDCEVYDCATNGFQIGGSTGSGGSHECRLIRPKVRRSDARAVFVGAFAGCNNCAVIDPDIRDAGTQGVLEQNGDGFAVQGGRVTGSGRITATSGQGIEISGTSDNARIFGVDARGNLHASTDIAYVGLNTKVAYNLGRYTAQGLA